MALSAAQRRNIPSSKFVYPPGSPVGGPTGAYPIDTPARARAALSYAGQSRTRGSYQTVAAAVRRRWPNIDVGGSSGNSSSSNSRNSSGNSSGRMSSSSNRRTVVNSYGTSGERESAAERRREARNPALEARESPARQRAEGERVTVQTGPNARAVRAMTGSMTPARIGANSIQRTSERVVAGGSQTGHRGDGRSERQLFGGARTRRHY